MRALVALKDADFQIRGGVWRSSNQMRIAAAVVTRKRRNKFVILHNKGMPFHTAQPPGTARARSPPAILGASSALRRPRPPTGDHGPHGRWQVKGDGLFWTFLFPPSIGGWRFRRVTSRRIMSVGFLFSSSTALCTWMSCRLEPNDLGKVFEPKHAVPVRQMPQHRN